MKIVNNYAPMTVSDPDSIRNKIISIIGSETIDKKQRGIIMKEIKNAGPGIYYDMAIVNKVIEEMLVR